MIKWLSIPQAWSIRLVAGLYTIGIATVVDAMWLWQIGINTTVSSTISAVLVIASSWVIVKIAMLD